MIISSFRPVLGGAEVVTERLANELIKQGVGVVVLTRRYPGFERFVTVQNLPVHRLGHSSLTKAGSVSFAFHALWVLATRLKDCGIVHAHNPYTPLLVGFLAKLLLGRRLFVTIHADPVAMFAPTRRIGPARLRLITRLADAIGVLSAQMEGRLVSMGVPRSRIRILPNSVDTAMFRPPTEVEKCRARSELCLDENLLVYLAVGSLKPVKGVSTLLRAWAKLTPGVPRRLMIVGDGPEREALERLASDLRVTDVSFERETDRVLRYLHAADVFVLASRTEGFSCALLEAMASGLAVVVSDIPGNRSLVRHGETGLTFPVGDIEVLAERLATLELVDARLRLGGKAHESVQKYATGATAEVHRRMYGL